MEIQRHWHETPDLQTNLKNREVTNHFYLSNFLVWKDKTVAHKAVMLGHRLIPGQLTTEFTSPTELQNSFRFRDSLSSFFVFYFWPHHVTCKILVPWPRMEPGAMEVNMPSANHWITREFLIVPDLFLKKSHETVIDLEVKLFPFLFHSTC